jgi:hypothetical protein
MPCRAAPARRPCLQAHDVLDLVAAQPLEHDELVDAVDELGAEVQAHLRGGGSVRSEIV